jgi:hypothetical protein
MRPDRIECFWEGTPIGSIDIATLVQWYRDNPPRTEDGREIDGPNPEAPFTPGQAIGLYVSYGKASFRNVVVYPLP